MCPEGGSGVAVPEAARAPLGLKACHRRVPVCQAHREHRAFAAGVKQEGSANYRAGGGRGLERRCHGYDSGLRGISWSSFILMISTLGVTLGLHNAHLSSAPSHSWEALPSFLERRQIFGVFRISQQCGQAGLPGRRCAAGSGARSIPRIASASSAATPGADGGGLPSPPACLTTRL